MMWPQILTLFLYVFGLGIALANEGKPRGNYSFISTLIATAFSFWVLYEGGFFKGL